MDLKRLQEHWELYGERDPFFAILSHPDKMNRQWDLDSFYATGRDTIALIKGFLEEQGIEFCGSAALDFGCGAGRLSFALSEYYNTVTGVDIAASMLELARKHNSTPEHCSFIHNTGNDLSFCDSSSQDFVLSLITLQHIAPDYSRNYLKEFLRILKPGGILVFQLPSRRKLPKENPGGGVLNSIVRIAKSMIPAVIYNVFRQMYVRLKGPRMEMYGIPTEEIREAVVSWGGEVLACSPVDWGISWDDYLYCVRKSGNSCHVRQDS